MPQFVVFLENDGLQKCITASAEEAGAIVFKSFQNKYTKKLFKIHNAWPLNKKHELPFKFVWFRRCLKDMVIGANEDIYFVFYESFHMTYSRAFLKHIKKKFPTAKLVFVFLNPVNDLKIEKYNSVKEFFDAGVAIYDEDAQKYNLLLNEYYCYKPPVLGENDIAKSDVFFVGANKGRLPRLIEAFEKMSSAGLACDFHITDVDEQEQKYKDKIEYNRWMTYEEALQRLENTECALEVLQDNDYYFSIRTIEAMHFHKKLLTTNKNIVDYGFYNTDIIQIFDDAKDIDTEFVKRKIPEDRYPSSNLWSFAAFEKKLIENV